MVSITHLNTLLDIKMTGYINKLDKNKITMSLMIKDIQLKKIQ